MQIEPFANTHVEDAAQLVLAGYRAEREAVEILPPHDGNLKPLLSEIEGLTGGALPGFAAIESGRLAGFLAGYPTDDFFGSHKGVYVPVTGQAASGADRRLIYQRLYAEASGAWVGEGRDEGLRDALTRWFGPASDGGQ